MQLPKHVHAVKRRTDRIAYYWQEHRGTPREGPRIRLPDPTSPEFWKVVKELQTGPAAKGGIARMIEAYQASPKYLGLAENTRREYDRHMAALTAAIGQFEPDSLRPHNVAQMRDDMGETPAKANAYVRSISALYKWGRELGHCTTNPAEGITKLDIGEYRPWPQWAWDTALELFRPELKIACMLGRHTGQRLGDVLRMKISDIVTDDEVHGFEVTQQKTKKELFVPVMSPLKPVIEEAKARGKDFIVSREDGTPFTVDQFHAMWGREMARDKRLMAIRTAGFSFHGLRKTVVVTGAYQDLTPHQIGAMTGQTIQTVQHYSRPAEQKRLAKAYAQKLEGPRE